ncbi:hypothetical protein L596_024099 [Steinernema carpocapsae]|uniref:Cysteine-rich DPF motif domain-containing protein 1 n=1 Tax=Steinernema carpocapsae TaxID=34508 RepID=A0A4U5MFR2_STECR|nr:hypothetical protein L596_024099 [Steinernema carpocapsae]
MSTESQIEESIAKTSLNDAETEKSENVENEETNAAPLKAKSSEKGAGDKTKNVDQAEVFVSSGETLDEMLESFECTVCGLNTTCYFFGDPCPSLGITGRTYCILNPFEQTESSGKPSSVSSIDDVIVMGGCCNVCGVPVCSDNTCQLFFFDIFCRDCALYEPNRKLFPDEVIKNFEENLRKREAALKNAAKQKKAAEENKDTSAE